MNLTYYLLDLITVKPLGLIPAIHQVPALSLMLYTLLVLQMNVSSDMGHIVSSKNFVAENIHGGWSIACYSIQVEYYPGIGLMLSFTNHLHQDFLISTSGSTARFIQCNYQLMIFELSSILDFLPFCCQKSEQ